METRTRNVTVTLDFKGREIGQWSVDRPLTVGRTSDNDIVIDNLAVSRHHAIIEPDDEGCVIRDAGSLNGVQVNGVQTHESVLANGDIVTLGKHRIVCHVASHGETADPSQFDPTMMVASDEVVGTIDNPGWLTEADEDATHALDRRLIVIGCDEAADIVVTGRGIAPYHAEIEWHDGVYTIRHLEGRRSVKVDGSPIDECVLRDGAAISIGDWTCAFHAPTTSKTTD
jgi:pSer/pThr/pTyr-binding forkhead associated (FHA) protein